MTELLIPSAWIYPCYGINLILIASLAIFKTMCRTSINITDKARARHMAEKYVNSVWSLPIGIRIRWKNSMEELLAYTSSHVFLIRFLLALNLVSSKNKVLMLLFIILVIKQLLGNVTSGIDIYSAKQSIIQWGKAEMW